MSIMRPDENWYCDACPMSIPFQDRYEARFRLELVRQKQGDEDEIMLAELDELGEVYEEDDWDEDFENEERCIQACSQEGAKHENI
jgi:hypothetical protein